MQGRRQDLNPRPAVYKTAALPLSYTGATQTILGRTERPVKGNSRGRYFRPALAVRLEQTREGVRCFLKCGGGVAPAGKLSPEVTRQIDSVIETTMAANQLPGVVVGVWIPGRGEYVTATGKANLTTGQSRDAAAPFRIASITKTFTATAILQLADAGKLRVSDKLSLWYPSFPNADKITVDDLLRMRSGIPDSADTAFLQNECFPNPTLNLTAEEMIARSAARVSEFKTPNEKTVYTNVNFILMERIIEKAPGQPIDVYIREKILDPLRMRGSHG